MTKTCLLIGFSYGDEFDEPKDFERVPLPGIIVDLYRAYNFAMGSEPDEIIVITDLIKDAKTSVLNSAMFSSTVDPGVLTFIEIIKERKEYIRYRSKSSLVRLIKEKVSKADELLVYYTGHARRGYLLLPIIENKFTMVNLASEVVEDEDILTPNVLRETIFVDNIKKTAQCLTIMDCCECNGLQLPYYLTRDKYVLQEDRKYYKPEILCIAATNKEEQSTTNRTGSVLTSNLFDALGQVRSIKKLNTAIPGHIRVSHPDIKTVWGWLLHKSDKTKIRVDQYGSIWLIET